MHGRARPGQAATWTLSNASDGVAEGRRLVSDQLGQWDLAALDFSTGLIVSELDTNAVRYSEGRIGLRLIGDTVLTCEVTDSGSASPHLRHAEDTAALNFPCPHAVSAAYLVPPRA